MLNKINFEVAKIANRTYNRTIHYVRWALTGDINFKMIQNWALMTATLIHSLLVEKTYLVVNVLPIFKKQAVTGC